MSEAELPVTCHPWLYKRTISYFWEHIFDDLDIQFLRMFDSKQVFAWSRDTFRLLNTTFRYKLGYTELTPMLSEGTCLLANNRRAEIDNYTSKLGDPE